MSHPIHRRQFLRTATSGTVGALSGSRALATRTEDSPPASSPGRAEACIFLWLGGGAAHTDTWDPKRLGDPGSREAGSAYPSIETSVPGVQVCEHLAKVARRLEHLTILRTVSHDVIDEHAAATNFLYTP